MSDLTGAYAFLSWLRRGLASGIAREDLTGPAAPRADAQIVVDLNEHTLSATASLTLAGPGDVAGLDPRAVIRVWPRPGVTDAESNYFPLLEFDQADLPWRYTPAKATPKIVCVHGSASSSCATTRSNPSNRQRRLGSCRS